MEFLVYAELNLPRDLDHAVHADMQKRESTRARELHEAGVFVRMWRVPGRRATWNLFKVPDATALHDVLSSFPMYPYFDITVHPLAQHPRDPLTFFVKESAVSK